MDRWIGEEEDPGACVGIERDGSSIVNPGPEEEFLAGDRVLILGEPAHCEKARALLTKEQTAAQPDRSPGRRRR